MSRSETLPLVLLPGHMGTALDWHFQTEALAGERPIIIPDTHFAMTSMRDMASNIVTHLPPRFDLAAWSMGGYIAFELYPLIHDRLRKLALLHTSARPESVVARTRRQGLLHMIKTMGMSHAMANDLDNCLINPEHLPSDFRNAVLSRKLALGLPVLTQQIRALDSRADSRQMLRQIVSPTLIVSGRRDHIAPVECGVEMAAQLPRSELHVLENAGHCSPWELAPRINALLRDFLSRR